MWRKGQSAYTNGDQAKAGRSGRGGEWWMEGGGSDGGGGGGGGEVVVQ